MNTKRKIPTFKCTHCRKVTKLLTSGFLSEPLPQRNQPRWCDVCIQNLEVELSKLRDSIANDLDSMELYELCCIADDIRMVFEDILKRYRVEDSMQLEEILNS